MKTMLLTGLVLCCFTGVRAQFSQEYRGQGHTTPSQTIDNDMFLYGGFVANDAVNYPASHGSLFGYTNSNNSYGYSYQIFKGHTAPQLNVRFANSNAWASWKKIYDSGNDMIYEGSVVESKISGYTHIYGRPSDGVLHLHAGTASGPVLINYYETGNVILAKGGGNVGIGTASPDTRLTVKGVIHTNEVRVDVNSPIDGPDYVFEKDYDLPSLAKLETYINQNKHLPEVPSANEMYENGVNLKEMNLLLLKKVEELTLYLIDMKKENDDLKKRVGNLEGRK